MTASQKLVKSWIDIAHEVHQGKWNHADDSTWESIRIGIRSSDKPICQQALQVLDILQKRKQDQPF